MTHIATRQNFMSSQDPIGSAREDSSLKVPLGEQVDEPTQAALQQSTRDSIWDFARRKHVPALLAAGGVVWLLGVLIRRSTRA